MTIMQKTIRAADKFLASNSELDDRIEELSDYVESLNLLLVGLEDTKTRNTFAREDLEQLAPLHDSVLSTAVALLGGTSDDLRALQAKGKAILAYTDTLPKRVSMRGKRKG